jgi:hypothetical protein
MNILAANLDGLAQYARDAELRRDSMVLEQDARDCLRECLGNAEDERLNFVLRMIRDADAIEIGTTIISLFARHCDHSLDEEQKVIYSSICENFMAEGIDPKDADIAAEIGGYEDRRRAKGEDYEIRLRDSIAVGEALRRFTGK